MKIAIAAASLISSLSIIGTSAFAQTTDYFCYMVETDGDLVDLMDLCGGHQEIPTPSAASVVNPALPPALPSDVQGDQILLGTDGNGCTHFFERSSLQAEGATRSYTTLVRCPFQREIAGIQFHSIQSYSQADCNLRQTRSLVWDFLDAQDNLVTTQEWIANDGTVGLPPVTESYSPVVAAEIRAVCS